MGIAEGILALALMLGGGYTWGYLDKDCPRCKQINYHSSPEMKEPVEVQDCLEKEIGECDFIEPNRYVVPESEYYKLKVYVGEQRLYLNACESVIEEFNKAPYIKD